MQSRARTSRVGELVTARQNLISDLRTYTRQETVFLTLRTGHRYSFRVEVASSGGYTRVEMPAFIISALDPFALIDIERAEFLPANGTGPAFHLNQQRNSVTAI